MPATTSSSAVGKERAGSATFAERLTGKFSGILRWEELDALWRRINASDEPWYLYQVGSEPPAEPVRGPTLAQALGELGALLRADHDYDYCGIVYVDDREQPTLVKVYDPNNLGASCGSSGRTILPRWILSRQRPEPIRDDAPLPNNRRRWWQRLLGGPGTTR
ncbi:MAG: hypothetical protein Kow006_00170 [Gammaproteobacteria bacterium]